MRRGFESGCQHLLALLALGKSLVLCEPQLLTCQTGLVRPTSERGGVAETRLEGNESGGLPAEGWGASLPWNSMSELSIVVATRHMCLLSPWNVARVPKELHFQFYLIVIITISNSHLGLIMTIRSTTRGQHHRMSSSESGTIQFRANSKKH